MCGFEAALCSTHYADGVANLHTLVYLGTQSTLKHGVISRSGHNACNCSDRRLRLPARQVLMDTAQNDASVCRRGT